MKKSIIAASTLLFSRTLLAQNEQGSKAIINGIEGTYVDIIKVVENAIRPDLTYVFWGLVSLSMVWSAIQWVLTEQETRSLFIKLTQKVFMIGIALACFRFAGTWGDSIIESFKMMGEKSIVAANGESNVHGSDLIMTALEVIKAPIDNFDVLDIGASIACFVTAILIILCYVKIAVTYILTVIESKFVVLIQLILFSLSGADWFINYFKSAWVYNLSIAVKLFIIYILVGVGHGMMGVSIEVAKSGNISDLVMCLVSAVFLLLIINVIPDKIESHISGLSLSGTHNGIQAMQSMAQTAATATVGAAGVAMAAKASMGYAAAKTAGSSSFTKPFKFAAHAMGGLSKAMGEELASKMKGSTQTKQGNMGSRLAGSLSNKTKEMKGDTEISGKGSSKPDESVKGSEKSDKSSSSSAKEKSNANLSSKMEAPKADSKESSEADKGKKDEAKADQTRRVNEANSDFSMDEAEELGAFEEDAVDIPSTRQKSEGYRSSIKNFSNKNDGGLNV